MARSSRPMALIRSASKPLRPTRPAGRGPFPFKRDRRRHLARQHLPGDQAALGLSDGAETGPFETEAFHALAAFHDAADLPGVDEADAAELRHVVLGLHQAHCLAQHVGGERTGLLVAEYRNNPSARPGVLDELGLGK